MPGGAMSAGQVATAAERISLQLRSGNSKAGSATGIVRGISTPSDKLLSDTCKVVTVMQPPSVGQHPCLSGSRNDTFPEQAHLTNPMPPPQNVNSTSRVTAVTMFANRFIFECKSTKKSLMMKV